MAKLTVLRGKAKGRELMVAQTDGELLVPFGQRAPELFNGVEPGDRVAVDNSDWLAFTRWYRHAVENNAPMLRDADGGTPREYAGFAVDGAAVYPQTKTTHYDLNRIIPFTAKVIFIGAAADYIWPTVVAAMDRKIRLALGPTADEQYRIWWVDRATHASGIPVFSTAETDLNVWRTRLVDYEPVGAQALLDVAAWVEEGRAPAPSTAYELTRDNLLVLAPEAAVRGGIQPVVRASVNGGERVEVRVGEPVQLKGFAELPPGPGAITEAAWDFDHTNTWAGRVEVSGTETSLRATVSHAYAAPGVYFPSFRVSSHRLGPAGRRETMVRNLARVRVVVHA